MRLRGDPQYGNMRVLRLDSILGGLSGRMRIVDRRASDLQSAVGLIETRSMKQVSRSPSRGTKFVLLANPRITTRWMMVVILYVAIDLASYHTMMANGSRLAIFVFLFMNGLL